MSEIEKTVRAYLNGSPSNESSPTDHTILCFVGMIRTGEADMGLFQRVGGDSIVAQIKQMMEDNGWTI